MDTSNDVYIHYGKSSHFDKDLFTPIQNRCFIKPKGGLWGSVGDSWTEWCKNNEFYTEEGVSKSFKFKVKGRVLRIQKRKDLEQLKHYCDERLNPNINDPVFNPFLLFCAIDFEKMSKNYNAIEVYAGSNYELYQALYGWDVDSICVLNPDAVVEVDDEGNEVNLD